MAGSVVDDLAAKLSLDSPSVSWESKVNILKNKHATEEECLEAVVFFRKLLSGGKIYFLLIFLDEVNFAYVKKLNHQLVRL